MPQAPRLIAMWIPVLMSALCSLETGCQCTISCAPPCKPSCGPNGCGGGGYGNGWGGGGGGCANGNCNGCNPAGSGQWGQGGNTPAGAGQWGPPNCCGNNGPPAQMGYAAPMAYPAAPQQMPPMQQQPMPDRGTDRMPYTAQGSMNGANPYQGALASGAYSQGSGAMTPYSQGMQGMPFGAAPMQQGNGMMPQGGMMQGSNSRLSRMSDNGDSQLPAPRMMPSGTETPYSP